MRVKSAPELEQRLPPLIPQRVSSAYELETPNTYTTEANNELQNYS